MRLVVIELVSASKLKTDFKRYERDEILNLSNSEVDEYIESLVTELMKDFQNGAILGNPDAAEINDIIDSFVDGVKYKFNNVGAVFLDRKFRYIVNAYFTANVNSINHVMDLKTSLLSTLILTLIYSKIELRQLLLLYHDNYSNQKLLNDLFFKLSTADDLDVTFEIHEKYLNNEFGVNNSLMMDLNIFIKLKVESIFEVFDKVESIVDIDEITADNYFDNVADSVKDSLKNSFTNLSDFEKTALINSGYDNALFHQLENAESEIEIVTIYLDVKEWFMNLYNNNGFAEISAERFERLNKKSPEKFADFDEYMKSEPKYDLKNFKFIKPEKKLLAF